MLEEKYLQMGPDTYEVPLKLFSLNRARLSEALLKNEDVVPTAYVLLEGGTDISVYNTDVNYNFRQVSDPINSINLYEIAPIINIA